MSLAQKTYENSILQLGILRKIEEIASASTQETVLIKDEVIRQNTLVTGVSSLLKEQNEVLLSIRDEIRQQKEVDQKKTDVLSGTPMKKLLMAAGIVAIMALGLYAFGEIFKGFESISQGAIVNGIAIALALIPITKAFSTIIHELPTELIRAPKMMINAIASIVAITVGFAAMGVAIRMTPVVSGETLLSALAIAGVSYVLGLTFSKLMEALTTNGIMDHMLNKNRTNQAMQTMVILSLAMVGLGLALRMAPKVNLQQAASFVVIAFALMPMAMALVALKFVFIMSRKIKTNDVLKTTGFLAILSMALIPISIAAALVPKLSPEVSNNIRRLAPILIPLSVVAAIIAAVINKRSQKKMMGSLLPGDQAPEPEGKEGMNPKKIAMVVVGLMAAAIGMIGVAYIISKSGGILVSASKVIGKLDYGGLFAMIFLVSIAALMVALVVNVMRGKGSKSMTTGLSGTFGGQQTQEQGKISTNDMIVAAATIPVVALGILAAAWIFQGLPGTFVSPDLLWSLKAGLSIFIFGMAMTKISKATKDLDPDDLIKGTVVSLAIALLITSVAYLFSVYPGDPSLMPSLKFIVMAAATILLFAIPFALITLAVKRLDSETLIKGVLATAIVAMALVGTAFVFSYLSSVGAFVAPPVEWSLKAGLAILVFGGAYALVSLLTSKLGISTMLQGIIGVAVIALAILAVGWIFNMLNGVGFVAPPISWSVAVALSLVAFTIPALAIGLIATSGIGAVGLLLGVVGMIVIAAGIWVVAWIFSKLPDLTSVSKMLTEALLTPVNGIVDVLKRLKDEIGVENLLPLAGGIIAIAGSLLVLAAASAGAAAAGLTESLFNAGKAFVDWVSGGETKGPLDILKEIINMGPQITKLAKPIEAIGRAVSFLMGGPDMEVMNQFILYISTLTPNKEFEKFFKNIASPFNSMMDALSRLNEDPVKSLKALFYDVPWKSIHEPVRSVAESMTTLAKSAMLAGTGVMLTANGMNIMVNALNRLTKENIDSVIKLFDKVNWPPLVDPINSIANAIHKMSINADKLGIGMKMSANALVLMSTIPVEILKEIALVFEALAKSDLESQGNAMLFNIAPALAAISGTMLVMRSDAYIRMFEVMASSSEAIVAMSKPMTRIASAMDKMGGVNVGGIEWAHKLARQLARSSFNSQASALEKMAKSYKDISKSSNTMDVEAINATTDMFKALAYLYQNGRKTAIEELGEKLTDAIQELARMIADFEGTVNDQNQGSKTVSEAVAKALDGLAEFTGLTPSGQSSDSSPGGFSSSSLQELIDLLQSGQAKITITDLEPAAEAKLA